MEALGLAKRNVCQAKAGAQLHEARGLCDCCVCGAAAVLGVRGRRRARAAECGARVRVPSRVERASVGAGAAKGEVCVRATCWDRVTLPTFVAIEQPLFEICDLATKWCDGKEGVKRRFANPVRSCSTHPSAGSAQGTGWAIESRRWGFARRPAVPVCLDERGGCYATLSPRSSWHSCYRPTTTV